MVGHLVTIDSHGAHAALADSSQALILIGNRGAVLHPCCSRAGRNNSRRTFVHRFPLLAGGGIAAVAGGVFFGPKSSHELDSLDALSRTRR